MFHREPQKGKHANFKLPQKGVGQAVALDGGTCTCRSGKGGISGRGHGRHTPTNPSLCLFFITDRTIACEVRARRALGAIVSGLPSVFQIKKTKALTGRVEA